MMTEFKRPQRDYPLSFKIAGVNRSKKTRSPVNRPGSDRVACQFLGIADRRDIRAVQEAVNDRKKCTDEKKDNLFNDRW